MSLRGIKRIFSAIFALVMLIGLLPTAALARTIIPVEEGNGALNLKLLADGTLTWDNVDDATGYTVDVCQHPGTHVYKSIRVDKSQHSCALIAEMDAEQLDGGQYRIEVSADGSGADHPYQSILMYYDSPYEKLPAPQNLRWNGTTAEWDAVPNAAYYNVYISNTTEGSLSVRSRIIGTSVDLADLSPQSGWFFDVIAYGDGYRYSTSSESPRKDGGSRNIIPAGEDNGALNLKLLADGTLTWDNVGDATGYTVDVCQHPGTHVYKSIQVNKSQHSCALIAEMDAERLDGGQYRIEVFANGSSAEHPYQSMLVFYDSPYTQLAAPANLHWNGLFASWDAVPGAEYYNVYVNNTTTGATHVKSLVKETFVALTEFSPQPGWFFEVVAFGAGYRHSTSSESPRKGFIIGTDTYNASTDELYSGGQVKLETEAGISDYSYVGESFEVTGGSEVSLTAQPDDGYEFVEWRIGSETGERYSSAKSIGFYVEESLHLVAVFHKSIPAGMGTIHNPVVCSTFEELKYALEHPTVQGIVVNHFDNDPYQTFYTLKKEKDFKAGHCAITIPANTMKYLTINADVNVRVPYVDYLLYSFIDNRGNLTIGGTGSLNVSMNARGYPSAILYNNGKLEIGGNVTFDPTNRSFDSVHGYAVINASGYTIINSGTFIGFATNAVSYQQGHLDIYGGEFRVKQGDDQAFGLNTDSYLGREEHDVNLYGGTFFGIRADQSVGADIVKLPDLLGYGAYYTYYADGTDFDPYGEKETYETLTVLMNNTINDVELTIDPPKQNGKPDQTVACGDTAYKHATGNENMWDDVDVYWEESTDGKTWTRMAANATFTVGKHYRASINVLARRGNLFAIDAQVEPNVLTIVNGYYATVSRYPEEDPGELICVTYDFGMLNDNIIEQIDIDGVAEPVVGESPSYNCAIAGSGYTINTAYDNGTYAINGMAWYDVTYDMWMKPAMTFQIGHEYKVFVDVKTQDGYEFYTTVLGGSYPPAGWGYINDNYATLGIQSDARFEQSLSWTFTCQPQTVKSVSVMDLEVPAEGFSPDYDAFTDSDYYTVESIEWTDYTTGAELSANDTFVDGHEYWVMITVVPTEEEGNRLCRFVQDKTVAYLNGIEVKDIPNDSWQEVQSTTRRVRIYYTFKQTPAAPTTQPGDINNDGKVNNKDLALLQQYLSDWDVTVDTAVADVNDDGKVNNKDLALLQQYLSDWDVELK